MTNLRLAPTHGTRPPAIVVAGLLAAGGSPLLIGLVLLTGSHLLYWALLVLAVAPIVGQGLRSRAATPSVVVGLILLLIAVVPFAARLVLGGALIDHQGLVIASPLGCAGLAGCLTALVWLARGGSGWSGALCWLGGCGYLAGAALCVIADTDHRGWDAAWNALGWVLLGLGCSLVGCLLMLIGGIAMAMSLRRLAGVRSSAGHPAGGW